MIFTRINNLNTPSGNTVTGATTGASSGVFIADVYVTEQNNDGGTGAGNIYKFEGYGTLSSIAVTPGTFEFSINGYGNIKLTTTGAYSLLTSLASAIFSFNIIVKVLNRSSTTGSVFAQGRLLLNNNGTLIPIEMAGTTTSTLNTQNKSSLGIVIAFSINNSGDSCTIQHPLMLEYN